MQLKTGFLLSYLKYGDNDAIIHCFTQENGYESFFVKGIYMPKNKKKAYFNPLNEIQLQINHAKNGAMPMVSKISLLQHLYQPNIKESCILFFIADFLNQMLRNEEQSDMIYTAIKNFIFQIEKKNYHAHFIFLFLFIQLQGFSPLTSKAPFLDPLSGCFSHQKTHDLFDEEISHIWKTIHSVQNPYNTKINNYLRRNIIDSILMYLELHFPHFKKPISLEVLQQIFED